jgi:SAM-dependent methyltransferase
MLSLRFFFFLSITVRALKVSHRLWSSFAAHYMTSKDVLISAEDVEILVNERRKHRSERNFKAADDIKQFLTDRHNIEIVDWPNSTWKYLAASSALQKIESDALNCSTVLTAQRIEGNLMWLAQNAYDLLDSNKESDIVESSLYHLKNSTTIKEMQGRKFADAAFEFSLAGINNNELFELLSNESLAELKRYGYRSSCRPIDIFQVVEKLAVAGILNQSIYHLAGEIILYKIENGNLNSSPSYEVATNRLTSGRFSLFDDMPLLWLWRFSARQRKYGKQVKIVENPLGEIALDKSDLQPLLFYKASLTNESTKKLEIPIFDDPTLPLIIDIGCGFGVSMLGLSYREKISKDILRGHNFIACDMSHRAISYASSISKRWGLDGKCCFITADAESFLELIKKEYSGPIEGIMINFPTPYQFGADDHITNKTSDIRSEQTEDSIKSDDTKNVDEDKKEPIGGSNTQLPKDMKDFMVTPKVIELCRQIFERNLKPLLADLSGKYDHDRGDIDFINNNNFMIQSIYPYLLIQTNVEDVAVTIKNLVTDSWCYDLSGGFSLRTSPNNIQNIRHSWKSVDSVSSYADDSTIDDSTNFIGERENDNLIQKRVTNWINLGGERARGHGWLKSSPLPPEGRTETEAMCAHEKKPVHRIMFLYEK